MTPRRDEPPSGRVVLAGAVAVLVMLGFVAAVAVGTREVDAPVGARLGVARADEEGRLVVLVGRCGDERVASVRVHGDDGEDRWRIVARKPSFDRRYVIGADEPPLGFDIEVPLDEPLVGRALTAEVVIVGSDGGRDGAVVDRTVFDAEAVPGPGQVLYRGVPVETADFERRSQSAARCGGGDDAGPLAAVFALGAAVAVAAYVGMVLRWWQGRRR